MFEFTSALSAAIKAAPHGMKGLAQGERELNAGERPAAVRRGACSSGGAERGKIERRWEGVSPWAPPAVWVSSRAVRQQGVQRQQHKNASLGGSVCHA